MTQALAEYRQHIDALNAEANRHLAEIKRIEEEKRQLSMTTEERIRDIRRQGMTEFEATEDRKPDRRVPGEGARGAGQRRVRAGPATGPEGDGSGRRSPARKPVKPSAVRTPASSPSRRFAGHPTGGAVPRGLSQAGIRAGRSPDAPSRRVARRTGPEDQGRRRADRPGKDGVNQAIQRIRESEEILNKTLDAKPRRTRPQRSRH